MRIRIYIFLVTGLIYFLSLTKCQAQIEKGVIVNSGFGTIFSGNLNKMLADRCAKNSFMTVNDSHSNLGAAVGLGVWVQYPISSRMYLQAGLSFNYQSSKLYINYRWDSLDYKQTGRSHKISTENSIKLYNLQFPVLMKYKLFEKRRYYFVSGITFSVSTKPQMKSDELNVNTTYTNGTLFNSDIERIKQTNKVDTYNAFNALLTIGLEKQGRRRMKNLSVRTSLGLPLTKSKFFIKNPTVYDKFLNNKALTMQGKGEMEEQADHKLNDFRNFTITLSLMYKISISKKSE